MVPCLRHSKSMLFPCWFRGSKGYLILASCTMSTLPKSEAIPTKTFISVVHQYTGVFLWRSLLLCVDASQIAMIRHIVKFTSESVLLSVSGTWLIVTLWLIYLSWGIFGKSVSVDFPDVSSGSYSPDIIHWEEPFVVNLQEIYWSSLTVKSYNTFHRNTTDTKGSVGKVLQNLNVWRIWFDLDCTLRW